MILHVCTIFRIVLKMFFWRYFFRFICLSLIRKGKKRNETKANDIGTTTEKCVYFCMAVYGRRRDKKKTTHIKTTKRTTKYDEDGKQWKERERHANSNICYTANNYVPSDQHIENYSLAHDIRVFWMRCYCIPHPW